MFVNILTLNLGQDFEAEFGRDSEAKFRLYLKAVTLGQERFPRVCCAFGNVSSKV